MGHRSAKVWVRAAVLALLALCTAAGASAANDGSPGVSATGPGPVCCSRGHK